MNLSEALSNYIENLIIEQNEIKNNLTILAADEIPFDSGMDEYNVEICTDTYDDWYYIGNCKNLGAGTWDDATAMAYMLQNSKYYPATVELFEHIKQQNSDVLPDDAFNGTEFICGVNEDEMIGFIYNSDRDMHYFFEVE